MKTKQIGDVIQTRLYLRPLGLSVCFYEIDHLLFDTGAPSQRKHLKKYLMDRPLEQVVVSHHHEDHTGMADWLERKKKSSHLYASGNTTNLKSPLQAPDVPLFNMGTNATCTGDPYR